MYLDDILIAGSTMEEHLQHLDHVLQLLETAGLKLNKSKCALYLGHAIDESGLHPTQESQSHTRSSRTKEPYRVKIFSWNDQLLQLIFTKSFTSAVTTIPIAEKSNTLVLEIKTT